MEGLCKIAGPRPSCLIFRSVAILVQVASAWRLLQLGSCFSLAVASAMSGILSWSTTRPMIGDGADVHFGKAGKGKSREGCHYGGKGTSSKGPYDDHHGGKGKSSKGPEDDGYGGGGKGKGKGTEPHGSKGKAAVAKQWGKTGKPWNEEAYGPEPNVEGMDQDTRVAFLLDWAAAPRLGGVCLGPEPNVLACIGAYRGGDPEQEEEEDMGDVSA